MAKLSTKERKSLPASKFAEPAERKYPIENASHAKNAKARASEMANKGRISGAAEKSIDKKADRVIARMGKKR